MKQVNDSSYNPKSPWSLLLPIHPSSTPKSEYTSLTPIRNYFRCLPFTKYDWISSVPPDVVSCLFPTMVGTTAFAITLSVSTLTQLSLFGISTGSLYPIPTLSGIVSVSIASIASHVTAVKIYQMFNNDKWYVSRDVIADFMDVKYRPTLEHNMRICMLGIILYKSLGGRFWSVSPSSYTNFGSFARRSIPATHSYATTSQRQAIHRIGLLSGCHTCGSRMILTYNPVKFHADHMPPISVMRQMNDRWFRRLLGITVKQRFYPQCTYCSNIQGKILSHASLQLQHYRNHWFTLISKNSVWKPRLKMNLARAGGGKMAYFHGHRLRLAHMTGGVIASLTICGSHGNDIVGNKGGNRKRFQQYQTRVEDIFHEVISYVKYAHKYFPV